MKLNEITILLHALNSIILAPSLEGNPNLRESAYKIYNRSLSANGFLPPTGSDEIVLHFKVTYNVPGVFTIFIFKALSMNVVFSIHIN